MSTKRKELFRQVIKWAIESPFYFRSSINHRLEYVKDMVDILEAGEVAEYDGGIRF